MTHSSSSVSSAWPPEPTRASTSGTSIDMSSCKAHLSLWETRFSKPPSTAFWEEPIKKNKLKKKKKGQNWYKSLPPGQAVGNHFTVVECTEQNAVICGAGNDKLEINLGTRATVGNEMTARYVMTPGISELFFSIWKERGVAGHGGNPVHL